MSSNAIGSMSTGSVGTLPHPFPQPHPVPVASLDRRQAPGPSTAIIGLVNALALSALLWGMGLSLWAAW